MSIRRWKIRSNQPDEGGSYCDSHTNACPLAFPDLGAKDEDEDGCVNDDDDDGCDDDDDRIEIMDMESLQYTWLPLSRNTQCS